MVAATLVGAQATCAGREGVAGGGQFVVVLLVDVLVHHDLYVGVELLQELPSALGLVVRSPVSARVTRPYRRR